MGTASRYWSLVKIDAAGGCQTEEILEAQAFFRQQFPGLVSRTDASDVNIQRQLLHLLRQEQSSNAELCLNRCITPKLAHSLIPFNPLTPQVTRMSRMSKQNF